MQVSEAVPNAIITGTSLRLTNGSRLADPVCRSGCSVLSGTAMLQKTDNYTVAVSYAAA
eukprot:SAG31_NODE_1517_length_8031_cov_18.008699_5_plen_59_part_00